MSSHAPRAGHPLPSSDHIERLACIDAIIAVLLLGDAKRANALLRHFKCKGAQPEDLVAVLRASSGYALTSRPPLYTRVRTELMRTHSVQETNEMLEGLKL